jgi:hypothetical protein
VYNKRFAFNYIKGRRHDIRGIQKAKKKDLHREAKRCFERYQDELLEPAERTATLLEAQFYLGELDRRSGGFIAFRDLILEIVVIALIGAEIWLAVKQGVDEDALMGKQNGILTSLQTSTSDTAKAMASLASLTATMSQSTSNSATTLSQLRSITETMNKSTQEQLSLSYQPSVTTTFDMASNKITMVNLGRTDIVITGFKLLDQPRKQFNPSQTIGPTGTWFMDTEDIQKDLTAATPKGTMKSLPIWFYIVNKNGQKFVVAAHFLAGWPEDKFGIFMQTESIRPEKPISPAL